MRRCISQGANRSFTSVRDPSGKEYPKRDVFAVIQRSIDDFIEGKRHDRFLILPGLRGTGKTTLLGQSYQYLLALGIPSSRILNVPMDEADSMVGADLATIIRGYESLALVDLEILTERQSIFLLVDEAQYDSKWAVTLKSLHDRVHQVYIIATGSSALHLSSSTDVTRRARIQRVPPLSLGEYERLSSSLHRPRISTDVLDGLFNASSVTGAFESIDRIMPEYAYHTISRSENSLRKYLRVGSLPFSLPFTKEEDVHRRTLAILDKIVFQDIPSLRGIRRETLSKTRVLLTLLSAQDRSSLQKLSNALEVSKPTLADMLNDLERSEILIRIPPVGSIAAQSRQTPRYKFAASSFRTALLSSVGAWNDTNEGYGMLLEDAVVTRFTSAVHSGIIRSVGFDPEDNSADFVVMDKEGGLVVVEIGYGRKDTEQVASSMRRHDAKYGVIVSDDRFQLVKDRRILFIPRELCLL